MILDRDLAAFADTYASLRFTAVDHNTGHERPWTPREPLRPGRDTLRLIPGGTRDEPEIELLVARSEGDTWVFHRGSGRIRRPLPALTRRSPAGLPYLAPEIVLLFKSRGTRPKDERDFDALLPLLTAEQRAWLAPVVTAPGQSEHPWQARLHGG